MEFSGYIPLKLAFLTPTELRYTGTQFRARPDEMSARCAITHLSS